jgi:lipopolysaccharide export system protein LptA
MIRLGTKNKINALVIAALFAGVSSIATASTALAQNEPAATSAVQPAGCPSVLPDTEIDITADLSEFHQKDRLVLLNGSVDVHQGPLRVRAESIKLSYEPQQASSGEPAYAGTVTTLIATGNVRVTCNGEKASGNTAHYDVLKRTIELTGKVMLAREGNILTGDQLNIDLNTGQSTIIGGKAVAGQGRVHAIFKPQSAAPDPAQDTVQDTVQDTESETEEE